MAFITWFDFSFLLEEREERERERERERDKNIVKIRNEIYASRAIRSGSESSDKCVLL